MTLATMGWMGIVTMVGPVLNTTCALHPTTAQTAVEPPHRHSKAIIQPLAGDTLGPMTAVGVFQVMACGAISVRQHLQKHQPGASA